MKARRRFKEAHGHLGGPGGGGFGAPGGGGFDGAGSVSSLGSLGSDDGPLSTAEGGSVGFGSSVANARTCEDADGRAARSPGFSESERIARARSSSPGTTSRRRARSCSDGAAARASNRCTRA